MSLEDEIRKKQQEIEQRKFEENAKRKLEELMKQEYDKYGFRSNSPVIIEPWPELRAVIDETIGEMTFDRPKIVHNMPDGTTLAKIPRTSDYDKRYSPHIYNIDIKERKTYSFDVQLLRLAGQEVDFDLWIFQNGMVAFTTGTGFKATNHCSLDQLSKWNITEELIREKIITRIAAQRIYVPTTEEKKKACYIATAVYGSYDCPEVWVLRRYRDNNLMTRPLGKLFVKVYYAVSPTVVKLFGDQKWFNRFWRKFLDKKVQKLKKAGFSDENYYDTEI